ncbi:MAG TPA: hypothetical protein VMS65_08190 [Polyangiaceae bacterium]|nr:hypothetical protein [Polyangiaceae bacterium]
MRLLTLSPIVVALGLGGVALAQPAGVIDPWARAPGDADSWFEPQAKTPEVADPAVKDPWVPLAATQESPTVATKRIDVFPVAQATAPVVTPLGPAGTPWAVSTNADVSLVDPWAPPVMASETPSLRGARRTGADRSLAAPWSERMVEIVDPWQRMPEFAATERVRLIFDPWAR